MGCGGIFKEIPHKIAEEITEDKSIINVFVFITAYSEKTKININGCQYAVIPLIFIGYRVYEKTMAIRKTTDNFLFILKILQNSSA